MTDIPPPPFTPPPLPPGVPPPPFGGSTDPGRHGPPWEEPGPLARRFAETVQAALLQPAEFFSTMRRTGGIGKPVAYGLIGTVIGAVFGAAYQMLLSSLMPSFGAEAMREQAFMQTMSAGCIVLVLPIVAVVSMFISAAIYHLILLLLGGARFGFETTMRVVAYSHGSTSLLGLIPFCGGLIGGIWGIVISIIGLSKAHEISTGKAIAAVLLPIAICCLLGILAWGAILAWIAAVSSGHSYRL